ncbi:MULTISPECIES: hypothetical protein [Pseudomonas]|uniref:Uncharacterized protein n=1 Tax=Pseudomonas mosselii TaxID=78327 RepID=A0A5R8ZFT5_9PSED|nr:hypothetical protein [Pseudomonas mosselii]TLP64639.1 hypothetical protein FEM01_00220 [Pseudomonas mosselii]
MTYVRWTAALLAWVVLSVQAVLAAPLQMTLYLDNEARQFLYEANQQILIVLPVPASQDNAVVVAMALDPPLADSTTLLFELDAELYVANGRVVPLGVIAIGLAQQVAAGQIYSFNGQRINGDGDGFEGHVCVYFDAPRNALPVTVGMAGYIYDRAQGKPTQPSPTNFFILQMFQTQIIARTTAQVWVLVGSGISAGSVLPKSILRPVVPTADSAGDALAASSNLQLGRYREVMLGGSNRTSLHYDPAISAFSEGPYPADR